MLRHHASTYEAQCASAAVQGSFVESASPAPVTKRLATAVLELLRAEAVHQHAEAHVRRAALLTAAQVGLHYPAVAKRSQVFAGVFGLGRSLRANQHGLISPTVAPHTQ